MLCGLSLAILSAPLAAGVALVALTQRAPDDPGWQPDWSLDGGQRGEWQDVCWGSIRVTSEAACVRGSASAAATTVETRQQGELVQYYGFDDSYRFFRVEANDGSRGYVSLWDAEVSFD